jgi:hypothetical protein
MSALATPQAFGTAFEQGSVSNSLLPGPIESYRFVLLDYGTSDYQIILFPTCTKEIYVTTYNSKRQRLSSFTIRGSCLRVAWVHWLFDHQWNGRAKLPTENCNLSLIRRGG